MRTCPKCARVYPEVAGADLQKCPFCGHETFDPLPPAEARPAAQPIADPIGALAHAAAFARRRYPRLLAAWIPVVVLDLAVSLSLVAYQAATPGTEDLAHLTTDQALALLGVLAPLYFLDFIVTFAAWSWVARIVLRDGGASPQASASPRGPAIAPALAVGALLSLALVAGLVLAIIPALILFHMFLFAPAALASGAGVGGSFDASRRFARERQTVGFTALMVLLAALFLAVAYGLGGLLRTGLAAADIGSPIVGAVADVLPGWLLWPLLPLLPASYWRLARASPQGVPAQAPHARPAPGTRRVTKCPTCGTLIPYQPTGAPVDVACPECGTAGRVV